MMIPSSKTREMKRKMQLKKKKDEIHLRYTNLACEVKHLGRRYSSGSGRPEYIYTWETISMLT